MTEESEAPRLQDTTERSALPLPLPEDEPQRQEREGRRRWRPLSGRGDESKPEPEPEAATDETEPVDPAFAPPAAEAAFGDGAGEGGARPEVLVGAAFLGGVALAFILKRLGP